MEYYSWDVFCLLSKIAGLWASKIIQGTGFEHYKFVYPYDLDMGRVSNLFSMCVFFNGLEPPTIIV